MGIQVWYARGVSSVVDEMPTPNRNKITERAAKTATVVKPREDKPAVELALAAEPRAQDQQEKIAPIEFNWITGASGMLLYTGDDGLIRPFAKDVLTFMDWRKGEKTVTRRGQFRWPQLASSTGTPQGAFKAFVEKNQTATGNWIAISQELTEQTKPWLENFGVLLIDVPVISRCASDLAQKKQLWQLLRNVE
ncbi:MAG: hypothetical protein GXP16_10665 [Gammaproteobacteria bacterium]|nr:hypothetical protein [Gammaproteobacteria bacterium]